MKKWIEKIWDEPIRVFPEDYLPLQKEFYKGDTRLIGSFEEKRLPRVMEATVKERKEKDNFTILEIDLADIPYFVALRDFEIYNKEKQKARSPNSQSVYLAISKNKMDGLLLQYLPPHSATSLHYHQFKTEAYHIIVGKATLMNHGKEIILERAKSELVYPHSVHQVITHDEPSLILLEIIGDPKGLSMDDHIYV